MDLVRPGLLLVWQISLPINALSMLDFPTFDRPRKATSGSFVTCTLRNSVDENKRVGGAFEKNFSACFSCSGEGLAVSQ